MEGIKETIGNTCRWTQGWLEENSARLDAVGLACVLMSLSKLVDSAENLQKRETLEPVEAQPVPETAEPEAQTEKPQGKETPEAVQLERRKKVDAGKIRALRRAGRSVEWIADDMQCSVATVYRALEKAGEEKEP